PRAPRALHSFPTRRSSDLAELVNWAAEEDIAVVLANGFDPLMRLNSVSPANFHGAYMATQHLIDAGHRRILHYTFRHRPTIRQRDRKSTRLNSSHVKISYA